MKAKNAAITSNKATPTKHQQVIDLLTGDDGASLEDMSAVTNWLPHSTRAFLTGLKKKGYIITSEKANAALQYQVYSSHGHSGQRRSVMGISNLDPSAHVRRPWNAGSMVGAKRPLKPRDVWAIRFFLDEHRRMRDQYCRSGGYPACAPPSDMSTRRRHCRNHRGTADNASRNLVFRRDDGILSEHRRRGIAVGFSAP